MAHQDSLKIRIGTSSLPLCNHHPQEMHFSTIRTLEQRLIRGNREFPAINIVRTIEKIKGPSFGRPKFGSKNWEKLIFNPGLRTQRRRAGEEKRSLIRLLYK